MFDPPFDAPPVLVALTIVAATTLGLATAIAPTPPGDAPMLAGVVDRVAASPVPTTVSHPTDASAVRIGPRRLWTRNAGGTDAATYATGTITPVRPDTRLARVLDGAPPDEVFRSPVDLETAARVARQTPTEWLVSPSRIRVRRVSWEDVNVTLVGV